MIKLKYENNTSLAKMYQIFDVNLYSSNKSKVKR